MQINRAPTQHDVIIIGSGAAGGMAAWNLTSKGVNVLMLDAGTKFDKAKFWSHVKPWEWRDRVEKGMQPPQFSSTLPSQSSSIPSHASTAAQSAPEASTSASRRAASSASRPELASRAGS